MRRDVFQAIADPTRRDILRMLAKKPLHLNAVAEHFRISRPAVSKHIHILEECGLVQIEQQGRERHCRARLDGLREVDEWLAHYRRFWEAKLDDLENYLSEIQYNTSEDETPLP